MTVLSLVCVQDHKQTTTKGIQMTFRSTVIDSPNIQTDQSANNLVPGSCSVG